MAYAQRTCTTKLGRPKMKAPTNDTFVPTDINTNEICENTRTDYSWIAHQLQSGMSLERRYN